MQLERILCNLSFIFVAFLSEDCKHWFSKNEFKDHKCFGHHVSVMTENLVQLFGSNPYLSLSFTSFGLGFESILF